MWVIGVALNNEPTDNYHQSQVPFSSTVHFNACNLKGNVGFNVGCICKWSAVNFCTQSSPLVCRQKFCCWLQGCLNYRLYFHILHPHFHGHKEGEGERERERERERLPLYFLSLRMRDKSSPNSNKPVKHGSADQIFTKLGFLCCWFFDQKCFQEHFLVFCLAAM